ncbi:hypothetical protein SLEP1_g26802 [Rubroshorea leprosula]|uniref:Uncharacterized protein n=1 Tax=Rubroshorea leprosula TaxID=152421 RepID=A0AAV5JVC4_9ROSI|nr:hypothetical protein SLEP1_g26802 [Rubroshorea leprosula]
MKRDLSFLVGRGTRTEAPAHDETWPRTTPRVPERGTVHISRGRGGEGKPNNTAVWKRPNKEWVPPKQLHFNRFCPNLAEEKKGMLPAVELLWLEWSLVWFAGGGGGEDYLFNRIS